MRNYSSNKPQDAIRAFIFRGGIPFTMSLICISVFIFLLDWFSPEAFQEKIVLSIVFSPDNFTKAPWTILTYPLFQGGIISLLIGCVFFWLSAGSLERSWGTQRFAVFYAAITVVSALSLSLGWYLAHGGAIMLSGFFLPLSGIIVAFCMLNPEQTIILYFFPLRAKYVALLITIVTYFSIGLGPVLSLFALGGILAAYLYVRYGRSWSGIGYARRAPVNRGPDMRIFPAAKTKPKKFIDGSPQRSALDFAGRWKDWQERKRLEKLWKNSGFSVSDHESMDDDERRRR